jgi:hypothetical protein
VVTKPKPGFTGSEPKNTGAYQPPSYTAGRGISFGPANPTKTWGDVLKRTAAGFPSASLSAAAAQIGGLPKAVFSPIWGLLTNVTPKPGYFSGSEPKNNASVYGWQAAADALMARYTGYYSGSEPKNTGTYEPKEDFSWREYLADPTKPEEAAPSLVEQSRIMGEIARAIANLDDGGAGADGGYMFDNGGYGWGDGWGGGGWGDGGGRYGPDSMLYMWRIGF